MHKVKEGVQATDGIYEKVKIWNGNSYQTVYRPMYFQPRPAQQLYTRSVRIPKKKSSRPEQGSKLFHSFPVVWRWVWTATMLYSIYFRKEAISLDTQLYIDAMHDKGMADAKDLQERSGSVSGTELYNEEEKIPSFVAACQMKNMLQRKAGFVCKSTAGRVVKLLQPYDSTVYIGEPETLLAYPAGWQDVATESGGWHEVTQ